jgi:hypothetical protein
MRACKAIKQQHKEGELVYVKQLKKEGELWRVKQWHGDDERHVKQ